MTLSDHVSAAIEILDGLSALALPRRQRPLGMGLFWYRFAGSKDRAAIANLADDALRKRASSAPYVMGEEHAVRDACLAAYARRAGSMSRPSPRCARAKDTRPRPSPRKSAPGWRRRRSSRRRTMCAATIPNGSPSGSKPPSARTRRRGRGAHNAGAGGFARQYFEDLARAGAGKTRASWPRADAALAARPADHARRRWARPGAVGGARLRQGTCRDAGRSLAARRPALRRAAGRAGAGFCAGGGGKTLALAAQMHNRGQIYASTTTGAGSRQSRAAGARRRSQCAGAGAAWESRCSSRSGRRAAISC